nr:hypothetical protein HK105_003202 [Polyrhizophydium stewartii]
MQTASSLEVLASVEQRTSCPPVAANTPRFAEGAKDIVDLLNRMPAELFRHVMLHADTLTRLLLGDLPRPFSLETLRAALADCFELDRTDIARALLLPPDACPPASREGQGEAVIAESPMPPVHPAASMPLTVELLLVRSRQMARTVAEAVRPAGVGLFTRLDLAALADETNAHPFDSASPRGMANSPRSGLLAGLTLSVTSGETARSPELADIARRVLVSLDTVGLAPHAVGWHIINQWIAAAAGLGDMPRVRMLLPHIGKMPPLHALDAAALHGHLDIVRLLAEECSRLALACTGRTISSLLSIDGGVVGGQIECIQAVHALDSSIEPSQRSVSAALERNSLAAVWWLLRKDEQSRRMSCFRDLQTVAARTGHMDVLEFAMRNSIGERAGAEARDAAAQGGHLAVLRLLHADCDTRSKPKDARGDKCALRGIELAATAGHLEAFEFLWEHSATQSGKQPAVAPSSMAAAARNGHMTIVESFMAKTQCALDDVLAAALAGGHLEIARIVFDGGRGTPSERCMVDIAKTGRVDTAAWVHDHLKRIGATVPNSALLMACRGNHADLVAFLIDECGLAATDAMRGQAQRYGSNRAAAVVASRM